MEESKKSVIIAYTGDFQIMNLAMFNPSILPALRIEGVFDSEESFEEWSEGFRFANEHTTLNRLDLAVNPTIGQIEPETDRYIVKTNKNLVIQSFEEVELSNDPRFSSDYPQSRDTEDGYEVACWARDEFDACKRAITELREYTTEINLESEVDPDFVSNFTIHMPTEPVVSFELPTILVPYGVGEILDIKYEDFITDPEEWELAQSVLENDVMVVDRILGDEVWLREGNPD